jgi:hypothetical protein
MKTRLILLAVIILVGVVLAQVSFTPIDTTQEKIISVYNTAKDSAKTNPYVKEVLLSAASAKEVVPDAKLDYVWHYGNLTVIDGSKQHTTTTLPPKPTTTTLKTKGGL